MDDQNRNLILATALSFLVILVWFLVFPPPDPVTDPNAVNIVEDGSGAVTPPVAEPDMALTPPAAGTGDATTGTLDPEATAEVALSEAARLPIESSTIEGSISLIGGRIDDLSLRNYNETLDEDSPIVRLLAPVGAAEPYYALYGWAPAKTPGIEVATQNGGTFMRVQHLLDRCHLRRELFQAEREVHGMQIHDDQRFRMLPQRELRNARGFGRA